MIVLTDTCAVLMLIRVAPTMFKDSRYGCVTLLSVYDEIKQTAKFAKKYPWRSGYVCKLNPILPGKLSTLPDYKQNQKIIDVILEKHRNKKGSPYGLSPVDQEVVLAATCLPELYPDQGEVKICSTDRNLVEFAEREFEIPNIEPLSLLNTWIESELIVWDENKRNILFNWISDNEPTPSHAAIQKFKSLTGEPFPTL